ncbi:HAMP domain-containing protein [Desulfovibrio aminophilus]|nr:CHASE sensor domain-containing protein [Desulfovibrio aminophilus]MCM0753794.1 HAMP domain-containing protein [Desulfovibrio aminophilus]
MMRNNSPRGFVSLRRKISAAILGLTLLALVLELALSVWPILHSYRRDAKDKALALAALTAASTVAALEFDDPKAAGENLAALRLVPSVTGAAVYTADGALFASWGTAPPFAATDTPQAEARLHDLTVSQPLPSDGRGGILRITLSLRDQWNTLLRDMGLAALILLAVFAVCVRVSRRVRRNLSEPLTRLARTVAEISRDKDYARRVDCESNDEIGQLVAEFNTMLAKIQEHETWLAGQQDLLEGLVAQRTYQLQCSTMELERKNLQLLKEMQAREKAEMIREEVERINRHDLKSALNLVIGYPDLLLREGGLNAEQMDHVKRIRAAGYRMLDMIRTHLDIFKMEKGIYSLRKREVDLVEIVCGLEEEFTPFLRGQGVSMRISLDGKEVRGDETFPVSGEMPLLRAMLRNLMQNAIEASASGDSVHIQLENAPHRQISVSNSQPVPREIRKRIFEKYVTCGKESGTGLGTYFAALVARTHGANIVCRTDDSTGTSMIVIFRDEARGEAISGR